MSLKDNSMSTHEKLLQELRAVIDNATMMLAYTENHTSDTCQEARRQLTNTLAMAKIELATFEAAQTDRTDTDTDNNDALPADLPCARAGYSGENAIFRAFR